VHMRQCPSMTAMGYRRGHAHPNQRQSASFKMVEQATIAHLTHAYARTAGAATHCLRAGEGTDRPQVKCPARTTEHRMTGHEEITKLYSINQLGYCQADVRMIPIACHCMYIVCNLRQSA
jgi:hypothetical protein